MAIVPPKHEYLSYKVEVEVDNILKGKRNIS